jgi:hypothetical protein
LRGGVLAAIGDAIEHADRVAELLVEHVAVQRDAEVAVGKQVVADVAALDELDIAAALQPLKADEGLELAEPDLEGRVESQVEIRIDDG